MPALTDPELERGDEKINFYNFSSGLDDRLAESLGVAEEYLKWKNRNEGIRGETQHVGIHMSTFQ